MKWPYDSVGKLEAAGYKLVRAGCRCRSQDCNARIVFYRTPRGATIPLDEATLQPHHATCKDVGRFRRRP